jgi:hypothetical protein
MFKVLTTIVSAGKSIKEIDFPSVTFCSQGNNDLISNASLIKLFYDFVETQKGIKVDIVPQNIVQLRNLVGLFCENIILFLFLKV